ncbi:hypothetical protein FGG78_13670 [Thioclava sp. BHET1]|nr:hypothetical protein FGG78_13670 [Thioclava sp. BHET1]
MGRRGTFTTPDLTRLARVRLEEMHDAAETVLECETVLSKSGMSVVSEWLRACEGARPARCEITDPETRCRYVFRALDTGGPEGEACQIDLYCDAGATASEANSPAPYLATIGLDGQGRARRLFLSDAQARDLQDPGPQGEVSAARICQLDAFSVELAYPNWAVNLWISALVGLFHPQLAALGSNSPETAIDTEAQRLAIEAELDR